MKERQGEDIRIKKAKEEVEAFLERLKYALNHDSTIITIQADRHVDSKRPLKYSNNYTLAQLFPDESPKEAVRRELKTLKLTEYIETIKDRRYPNLSHFWVFGRKYNGEDVYIKIRVEIVQRNCIFVMSFHFSTRPFVEADFPYAKKEEGK